MAEIASLLVFGVLGKQRFPRTHLRVLGISGTKGKLRSLGLKTKRALRQPQEGKEAATHKTTRATTIKPNLSQAAAFDETGERGSFVFLGTRVSKGGPESLRLLLGNQSFP